MNLIKIGIIGTGKMGENHCQALKELKNSHFIGIYDIDHDKCRKLANKYGVASFSDVNALLSQSDAVIIATPTSTHYELIIQALTAHCHIFVEKPIVTSLDEIRRIENKIAEQKLLLQVGHIERFNPAIQEMQKMINVDDILSMETRRTGHPNRNLDIDVIFDLMIHDIDIVSKLAKTPVKHIAAMGRSATKHENPDIVSAILTFDNGVIANLVANRNAQENARSLKITGRQYLYDVNYLSKELSIYSIDDNFDNHVRTDSLIRKIKVPQMDALKSELNSFIQSIIEKKPPLVSLEDGKKALEVALKIKEALKH